MLSKKVLLVTYHFPPSAASGTFRLLGFARHLPTFGWRPLVVAPPSLPWEPTDPRLSEQIPGAAIVESVPYPAGAPRLLRKFAQNAIWLPAAWSACKRLITEDQPDVILTSGPPHCVHMLGRQLKRATGLPWVADFRDPWISDGSNRRRSWTEQITLGWERAIFQYADLILANAPNARRMFSETYPLHAEKIVTLTNGFDPRLSPLPPGEGSGVRVHFSPLPPAEGSGVRALGIVHPGNEHLLLDQVHHPHARPLSRGERRELPLTLLHAGEIYAGRDPMPLFQALAQMNARDSTFQLNILGRNEVNFEGVLAKNRWNEFVHVLGQRGYQDSLDEMSQADILVLFDGPGRTIGVPAKLYEYLGAGRPILALAEPLGDTATILRKSGVLHRMAAPTDPAQIQAALGELVEAMWASNPTSDADRLAQFTRRQITGTLAEHLDMLSRAGKSAPVRIGHANAPAPLQESAV